MVWASNCLSYRSLGTRRGKRSPVCVFGVSMTAVDLLTEDDLRVLVPRKGVATVSIAATEERLDRAHHD